MRVNLDKNRKAFYNNHKLGHFVPRSLGDKNCSGQNKKGEMYMKLKKPLRRVLMGLLVVSLMAGSAIASSAVTKRTINITYRGIKMVVDGVEVVPKDAAGNPIEPFIEDASGTTYLPVRGIGSALGKPVDWDGETSTVYIGSKTKTAPYQVNHGTVYSSDPAQTFEVAGIAHNNGVVLRSVHSSTNEYNSSRDKVAYDGTGLWNTEGFETMTFKIGHVGDLQRNATLYIALDRVSFKSYELTWDGSPQEITIPLGGAANVKLDLVAEPTNANFQYDSTKNFTAWYGIYDIILA